MLQHRMNRIVLLLGAFMFAIFSTACADKSIGEAAAGWREDSKGTIYPAAKKQMSIR